MKEDDISQDQMNEMWSDMFDVIDKHGRAGMPVEEMVFMGISMFTHLAFTFADDAEEVLPILQAGFDYGHEMYVDDDDDQPSLTVVH